MGRKSNAQTQLITTTGSPQWANWPWSLLLAVLQHAAGMLQDIEHRVLQAVVNEDLAGDAALLKAEIGRLAEQLAQARAEIALHKVEPWCYHGVLWL